MANRAAAPADSKGAIQVVVQGSSGSKIQSTPNAGSKPDSQLKDSNGSASAELRRLMIAEAAYYISERRGFAAGCQLEDWLLAEKQIDALLSGETAGAPEA